MISELSCSLPGCQLGPSRNTERRTRDEFIYFDFPIWLCGCTERFDLLQSGFDLLSKSVYRVFRQFYQVSFNPARDR